MKIQTETESDIQAIPETAFSGRAFPSGQEIKHILVIRLQHIGDVLLPPLNTDTEAALSAGFY